MNTYDLSSCLSCNETGDRSEMLEMSDGTTFCINCFRKRIEELMACGDNEIYEQMYPDPEELHLQKRRVFKTESYTSFIKSKKINGPFQCPNFTCNKCISLITIESHFKYEHSDVPFVITRLNSNTSLEFFPKEIHSNVMNCLLFFNLKFEEFDEKDPIITELSFSRSHLQEENPTPLLMLMATRSCNSAMLTQESLLPHSGNSSMIQSEKILIWICSNLPTDFRYTVAVSDQENERRCKFHGPVSFIANVQLRELFLNGDGLILTCFHVDKLSDGMTKPLNVDVVLHGN